MTRQERAEYLEDLADEFGVPLETVWALAEILGPGEDRDGLVNALEDAEYYGWI